MLRLTNEARARTGGLPALLPEDGLHATARVHSADMLARGFFDHVNPDGLAPKDRVALMHRRLVGRAGENIWRASGLTAADSEALATTIVNSWMHSPGHRANILDPGYTHLGVGVASRSNELMSTQNFGEVRAYLDQDAPATLAAGTRLVLPSTPYPAGAPAPVWFDLWSSATGKEVTDRLPVAGADVSAPPGSYKLRLYVPDSKQAGRYTFLWGPEVEVK